LSILELGNRHNNSSVRALAPDESVPASGNARAAMQDFVMFSFTVVFFALAFLYVKGCQKLR